MSDCPGECGSRKAAPGGSFMAALILVVDDDPIQRRLLEAMTRRFGYEVETAEIRRRGAGAARGGRPSAGRSDRARSGDARPRRHGRIDAPAAARRRHPRHRANRPWLDRGGDLGDARRRLRLRRQAGRRRTTAGVDQERAARRRARGRAAARDAPARRRADVPRRRHQGREHGAHHSSRRARRQVEYPGADRRRIGRRQGTDGARHPGRLRSPRQAVRHRQLRRAAGKPRRVDPVRP